MASQLPRTARQRSLRARARLTGALVLALSACSVPSDPNPPGAESSNTYFVDTLAGSPKYLDSTSSYASNEAPLTYLIYEPLYHYEFLKRPYVLTGGAAESVVRPHYLDGEGHELPADAPGDKVVQSVYDIKIREGMRYAPHPAFARNPDGSFVYRNMKAAELVGKSQITDFGKTGTREVVAADFVYAIKRLATPRVKSPAFSLMRDYIVGLAEFGDRLRAADLKLRAGLPPTQRDLPFLDLRRLPIEGAVALDDHTLRIRVVGKYPQFNYWLAMTFFAPVPWEAEAFYAQPGMAEHDFSYNFAPVGAGPFMAVEYAENRRHVLVRNPNFHGRSYPCEGEPGDREAGLLDDCGKALPFLDKIVFTVDKERLTMASKFKQGFIDEPDIEHLEAGMQFESEARDSLETGALYRQRGYRFPRSVDPQIWYIGFNWLDPVVGRGRTPEEQARNRKLREALQIALNWEEYSEIFQSQGHAGPAAMGPIPPGVFGFRGGQAGMNPIAYEWKDGRGVRRPIEAAKKLMVEAGYPDGRDAKSGRPLVLNYDYGRASTPENKAENEWVTKQFAKLGIQLDLRVTDFNRFQEKMDNGSEQIYWWGWYADYPDAENFMFLLFGPNSKAATHGNGENAANYQNDEFDRLFLTMKFLEDGPQKQAVLDRMTEIVRADSPWLFGYYPFEAGSLQPWTTNGKPTSLIGERLMYRRVDVPMRQRLLRQWNPPVYWPLPVIALLALLALVPAWRGFVRHERASALAPSATAPPGP